MRVFITIEARMASKRLPGKVMLPIAGKPMLSQLICRVKNVSNVDGILVLTSKMPENKVIIDLAEKNGVGIFAGSENDLVDRIVSGTKNENPHSIVQLTADNPLVDPKLIEQLINFHKETGADYTSNNKTQNVIIGQNLRCFSRHALLKADKFCTDDLMRAHGGYVIQQYPNLFSHLELSLEKELLRDDIRLTVDEPEDYFVVSKVFEALGNRNMDFSAQKIVEFLDKNPSVRSINSKIIQKSPGTG